MVTPFSQTLKQNNLQLKRAATKTLQVNVGLLCNLACRHCHLECGPTRPEVMSLNTMKEVVAFAKKNSFELADITGGAPEMVADLPFLLDNLSGLIDKVVLRSNLTLLLNEKYKDILDNVLKNKIGIIASFPSVNKNQTDNQRGEGTWDKSIQSLKKLNELGFGKKGTGLELILVSNPSGAFMPVNQCQAEKQFKKDLARKWDIHFTNLFTFANIPMGRFKTWLEKSGNYEKYMAKLEGSFNPETVSELMCRSLISISWDGHLYDCDFNQAGGFPHTGTPAHIRDIDHLEEGTTIVTDNHCYGCTAGAGFT